MCTLSNVLSCASSGNPPTSWFCAAQNNRPGTAQLNIDALVLSYTRPLGAEVLSQVAKWHCSCVTHD